ncbi:hypothetical protein ABB37_00449 [Leptomonas pyrrhocoris]|uniref:SET domain-containing protein n=1 Tax=Leptomonas pyrrhocoris TaxID=157538 RepID=A0A0M9GAK9_LEPPY|nr:hypothetical protein ABB37_00449 [Leptomonas pyrrhocoris]KPA86209.1 hypothetical protein ABB37_00449 [Leptomonas pyrrhocoris]|eukprot:XP_015664648.1 hypothetical protein ABB37_00449 [Leptomonas pyrrhocoris]
MLPSLSTSSTAVPPVAGASPTATAPPSHDVLRGLRCSPSRRAVKFTADAHSRHFLAFDTSISRETRLVLFMEVFVFRHLLVDAAVVPAFQVATYTPEELLEVRVVTDPRHPAYGQAGLYAKSPIPYNAIVTPYSGFIEVFATSCNSRTYTMGFGSIGDDYALDAEFVGNYGRYANDPRGVGTLQANLSAENRFNSRGESYTALVARRQISAGEEILMSYGKAHRLSATPWVTMQGEPMMRPRVGGVVPFPAFRTVEAAVCSRVRDGDRDDVTARLSSTTDAGPSTRIEAKRRSDDSSTVRATASPASSSHLSTNVSGLTAAVAPESNTAYTNETADALADTASSPPLPSVAYDLLWECPQCGMWTLCEASVADMPLPCSACGTPKLSGARLISLLSSPAITQRALLQEVGPLRTSRSPPQDRKTPPCSSTSPLPPSSPSSAASSFTSSSPPFSSEHTDWPMNVPFLPWQVWDAAVPMSVLAKHSRFDTQEHVFIYTVDTGLDEEKKKRGRDNATGAAAEQREHGKQRTETPPNVTEDELSEHSDSGREKKSRVDADSAPSVARTKFHLQASQADPIRSRSRRNGVGRHGGACHRLIRGELWARQGDVDPADLARLNRGLTPAVTLISAPASEDSTLSAHVFSPFSLSPRQLQQSTHTRLDAAEVKESLDDFTKHGSEVEATLAKSPLSLLMSPTQEVDRLIVLRRAASVGTTSAAVSADTDDVAFSPQLASMRRRLQCMTRRLFTGKAFQPGEVVSYVGGLVRRRGDSRCRVSDSCLEIPLRFFLPPTLRERCRVPTGAVAPTHGATATQTVEKCSSEGITLQRFCQRIDGFSLVVTNEFMYCPCVVWEEEAQEDVSPLGNTRDDGRHRFRMTGAEDDVESALSACNVALVLTLDSLGCPYACAVATKAIRAFEPLLARAQ